MSKEIQQAQNGLKIQKAVLECEEKQKQSNKSHSIGFYLEKYGYDAEFFQCSQKDKKFSWLKRGDKLYIQVSEAVKRLGITAAYFVEL